MEFTVHDKHVADLYKKAVIKRQQDAEILETKSVEEAQANLDKNFWTYLEPRLKNLFFGIVELEKRGIVAKGVIDKMKQDSSDLMNMVCMYTMPEVIAQLINESTDKVLRKRQLEKIQKE